MQPHFRTLRLALTFTFLITLYFAYLMLLDPSILMEIYDVTTFDTMHRYLSMVGGALMIVIAIGAGLAFLQPVKYAGIVTLLIIYHFARFVVDMILVAQGDVPTTILLPEMVYFLLVCVALIRFFPVKPKEEPVNEVSPIETEPEKIAVAAETTEEESM